MKCRARDIRHSFSNGSAASNWNEDISIGATGTIGGFVVKKALRGGHTVRALVRSAEKARQLPTEAQVTIGDITRPETLVDATDGVDAIVFTHSSYGCG
jgi:uncharacterized protein YbjT (DUF2867 family)